MANPSNPRYTIIRAQTTHHLVAELQPVLADGVWECLGAPFFDSDRREWCQTVVRKSPEQKPGEIALREPKRRLG